MRAASSNPLPASEEPGDLEPRHLSPPCLPDSPCLQTVSYEITKVRHFSPQNTSPPHSALGALLWPPLQNHTYFLFKSLPYFTAVPPFSDHATVRRMQLYVHTCVHACAARACMSRVHVHTPRCPPAPAPWVGPGTAQEKLGRAPDRPPSAPGPRYQTQRQLRAAHRPHPQRPVLGGGQHPAAIVAPAHAAHRPVVT